MRSRISCEGSARRSDDALARDGSRPTPGGVPASPDACQQARLARDRGPRTFAEAAQTLRRDTKQRDREGGDSEVQVGVGHRAGRPLPRRVRRQRPGDARHRGSSGPRSRRRPSATSPRTCTTKTPQFWNEVIQTRGASDLYVQQNTWQPGGSTGWHTHPGPSFVIVTQGSVTVYEGDDSSCTPHVYTAGYAQQLVRRHRRRRCAPDPERDRCRREDHGGPVRPGRRDATAGRRRSRPLLLLIDAHAALERWRDDLGVAEVVSLASTPLE